MAFRALRRTVAEIDERHPDAVMTTGDHSSDEPARTDRSASRRGFLTRAATGGALAVGASALSISSGVPRALAQTTEGDGSEPTAGTTPGTEPTAPAAPAGEPPIVEGTDLVLVVFLQSIELAASEAYNAMVETGKLAPAVAQTARQFTLNHTEHAKALAELAGGAATTVANPRLISELTPRIAAATTRDELATIAYELEESIAATYAATLGQFDAFQAAGEASRILPVDSQQAIVWSQVLYPDTNEWATQITRWIPNFQSASGAINITEYAAS